MTSCPFLLFQNEITQLSNTNRIFQGTKSQQINKPNQVFLHQESKVNFLNSPKYVTADANFVQKSRRTGTIAAKLAKFQERLELTHHQQKEYNIMLQNLNTEHRESADICDRRRPYLQDLTEAKECGFHPKSKTILQGSKPSINFTLGGDGIRKPKPSSDTAELMAFMRSTDYHLPDLITPLHYKVKLFVHYLWNETFDGSVTITFTAQKNTDIFVLHRSHLQLDNESVAVCILLRLSCKFPSCRMYIIAP